MSIFVQSDPQSLSPKKSNVTLSAFNLDHCQLNSLQILNEKMQEETEEQVGCEGLCQMGGEEMGAGGQRRVRERMCCQGLHQAPSLINPLITATTWQP